MRNFFRALHAWPYRYRLLLSVFCALFAAVLWGLNFTALYPVLKILGSDQNLQEWANSSIERVQREQIEPLQKQVEEKIKQAALVEKEAPGAERDNKSRRLAGSRAALETKLESAWHELYRYQIIKRYVDMLFPIGRFHTLAVVLLFFVVGVAIKGLFEFCQETMVGSVVNRCIFDLRNRFFTRTVHLDVNNFNEHGTHEMMARCTNDMELVGNGLRVILGKMIAEPLRAVACVAIACWISWQLTFLFLVLVPFALFVLAWVGRAMKRATRRLLERMSNIYKILQESFLGIRIVKAFTGEARERARFHKATKEYYKKGMLVVKLDALTGPIIEILGIAAIAGALLAGAYLVIEKQTHLLGIRMTDYPLEAEGLLQLYALLAATADPVRKLSSVFTRIQSGAAAADRVFQFMDKEPRVQPNSLANPLERHHESIEFRNICFSYEPGRPILTSIDLTIRHGETVAFVGKNGCGKSTLLGLLMRFYDPDHGTILVDNVDLRGTNLRSLRRQVALVTQETILFDDSIHGNIAYGRKNATREEVEQAARQARAHDFIVNLAQGYDTRAGEAGTKLSGGQRQRLALARAMLRDPSILILDEFTSAADAETEMEVHRILRDFTKGRTTLVITHRLNTLEIADRIVVLDNGRIVAVGSHAELLRSCNVYQRLHEAQFQRMVA